MSGQTQVQRLTALATALPERDRAVVADTVRLRFLTAGQLSRLHFASIEQPVTRIRRVQRTLARLVERGLLLRCDRRVGGVRAGSASYTYAPTAEAIRLTSYLADRGLPRARTTPEPGTSFVDHTVAVNDVYVRLVEAERTSATELLEHQAEPECWRTFLDPIGSQLHLRPDAFAAVGVGELEHRSFIEVDRGTEGSTALRRKLAAYEGYWRSGAEQHRHGVFPRVIWQVDRRRRAAALRALIDELSPASQQLFVVTELAGTVSSLHGSPDEPGSRP
jgi:hypothetical protein